MNQIDKVLIAEELASIERRKVIRCDVVHDLEVEAQIQDALLVRSVPYLAYTVFTSDDHTHVIVCRG